MARIWANHNPEPWKLDTFPVIVRLHTALATLVLPIILVKASVDAARATN